MLDGAIFFFLCLFAILLPHSIKGSQHAWQIAFLLWLMSLVVARRRPFPQPLSAPLLAYVTLERNFHRAQSRPVSELGPHEDRLPAAGRHRGGAKPAAS